MSKYLSEEEKNHITNFQDDFLGFHDEIPALLRIFEGFLRLCSKAGITLNPTKIRIDTRKSKFYGFILNKNNGDGIVTVANTLGLYIYLILYFIK